MDGSEFAVRAVATSRMVEDMDFVDCGEVGMSGNAFEGHSFPKLRVANFDRCFNDSADGSDFVVRAVATSRVIEYKNFFVCGGGGLSWEAFEGQ